MKNVIKAVIAVVALASAAGAMDINGDLGAYLEQAGRVKAAPVASKYSSLPETIVVPQRLVPARAPSDYYLSNDNCKSQQEAAEQLGLWMAYIEKAGALSGVWQAKLEKRGYTISFKEEHGIDVVYDGGESMTKAQATQALDQMVKNISDGRTKVIVRVLGVSYEFGKPVYSAQVYYYR